MEQQKKTLVQGKTVRLGLVPYFMEGWVIILIYAAIITRTVVWAEGRSHSASDMLILFAPYFIIITGLFLVICYKKGERLKWRWGEPRD